MFDVNEPQVGLDLTVYLEQHELPPDCSSFPPECVYLTRLHKAGGSLGLKSGYSCTQAWYVLTVLTELSLEPLFIWESVFCFVSAKISLILERTML